MERLVLGQQARTWAAVGGLVTDTKNPGGPEAPAAPGEGGSFSSDVSGAVAQISAISFWLKMAVMSLVMRRTKDDRDVSDVQQRPKPALE